MNFLRLLIFSFFILLFSCQEKKTSVALYPSESSKERVEWEIERLADPYTGEIPANIRQKELLFAKNLPKSNSFSKNNWLHRGPYNVGGRTRALCLDVLDENTILAGGIPSLDLFLKEKSREFSLLKGKERRF